CPLSLPSHVRMEQIRRIIFTSGPRNVVEPIPKPLGGCSFQPSPRIAALEFFTGAKRENYYLYWIDYRPLPLGGE
ncbi:MAG: hypothetical protein V2B19_18985, partial [Pseudomonadota bacterium]